MLSRSLAALLVLAPAVALAQAAPAPAEAPPTPEALLGAADRARGGLEKGITWSVTLVATESGETTERTFLVKARGDDAYVEALAPARNKGELMIFNDRTIWFTRPGLRKPVSLSARQRLSGLAANGDIATTNYARDYTGVVEGEDTIAGEPAYRLALKAKASSVTYDRIRYWISKAHRQGIKAEFLTLDGALFKTATFTYGNKLGDLDFVSRMSITDASSQSRTDIRYDTPRSEEHAPSLFNINNVAR